MPKNIVIGQKVTAVKIRRSKELRQNMTEAEQVLWQHLRTNRLDGFHFRRQQIISGFIVDFYCHAAGLVVEVDGEIHEHQRDYDTERDKVLSTLGLRILRFKNAEVHHHLASVLKQIAQACHEMI